MKNVLFCLLVLVAALTVVFTNGTTVLTPLFVQPAAPAVLAQPDWDNLAWHAAASQHDWVLEDHLARTDGRSLYGDKRLYNSDEVVIIRDDRLYWKSTPQEQARMNRYAW